MRVWGFIVQIAMMFGILTFTQQEYKLLVILFMIVLSINEYAAGKMDEKFNRKG